MRALVVSDELFATSSICAIVGRAGYTVETVTSAAASERLARDLPDLVVVDWLMNDVDGTTLVRALRKRVGRTPPVVMTSSLTEEAARAHALKIGADEYVTKPVSEDALLAAIGRLAPRASIPPSSFTPVQRALFSHAFWSSFEIHAAKHAAEFLGVPVEGTSSTKPGFDTGAISAMLGMYDVAALLEVELALSCSLMTGKRIARPLFRGQDPDEATIREMLGEMSNTILGRAKGAFRLAGLRFTLSLPSHVPARIDYPATVRASLSGSFGVLQAVLGARPLESVLVRGSELRENMILIDDVKTDVGDTLYPAGTRLTNAIADRLVRHLALRHVKVSAPRS